MILIINTAWTCLYDRRHAYSDVKKVTGLIRTLKTDWRFQKKSVHEVHAEFLEGHVEELVDGVPAHTDQRQLLGRRFGI